MSTGNEDSLSKKVLNKAFSALGALFFWSAFLFIRYWSGPAMWEKKGLYALGISTAFLGLVFTTVAGSLGAELSLGRSVIDPVYGALSLNFYRFTLQPMDVDATAAVTIIAIVIVALLKPKRTDL